MEDVILVFFQPKMLISHFMLKHYLLLLSDNKKYNIK
jgi:hypothetical protein